MRWAGLSAHSNELDAHSAHTEHDHVSPPTMDGSVQALLLFACKPSRLLDLGGFDNRAKGVINNRSSRERVG